MGLSANSKKTPTETRTYEKINFKLQCCYLLALIVVLCAACCPSVNAETPAPRSTWGEITLLGETAAAEAPQLLLKQRFILAMWTQTGDRGVQQVVYRQAFDEAPPEQVALPLAFRSPYNVQLIPGFQDHMHLLWLDERSGLQNALINPAFTVERGPALAASAPVFHYDAILNSDYSVWVVWSSGQPAEPILNLRVIDPGGRPQLVSSQLAHGDWPVLARTSDERIWLFWLNPQQQIVYRGELVGETLNNVTPLAASIPLQRGDYIADFSVGIDASYGYLLWNVIRQDGSVETWITSGDWNTLSWADPVRLGIEINNEETFTTGFNGGSAQAATSGSNWLGWSSLLAGQFDHLAIAAHVADELGIVYLHEGEIRGYQPIVSLETHALFGQPAVYSDAARHLYLVWSQPTSQDFAELNLTTTR